MTECRDVGWAMMGEPAGMVAAVNSGACRLGCDVVEYGLISRDTGCIIVELGGAAS